MRWSRRGYWNVVVTVRDDGYAHARRALPRIGAVAGTPLFNVLVMRTDDVHDFLTSAGKLFHDGHSSHVRLHRRGAGAGPSHVEQERHLDQILPDELEARGTPGTVSFDDPDVIIDIEVVGRRAGMAVWTRADLERYPFLRVD